MRWELVERGSKPTKRPLTLAGRAGSSTNPATWSSYADARRSSVGRGLGFALGRGIGCVDLDDCIRPDGSVEPWAAAFLERCPATFIEVSQSGSGLHVFGLLAERPGRNLRSQGVPVEVYSTGRYIAVTGNRYGSSPTRLADISDAVASLTGVADAVQSVGRHARR